MNALGPAPSDNGSRDDIQWLAIPNPYLKNP